MSSPVYKLMERNICARNLQSLAGFGICSRLLVLEFAVACWFWNLQSLAGLIDCGNKRLNRPEYNRLWKQATEYNRLWKHTKIGLGILIYEKELYYTS
jgi:hypothetical protein